MSQSTVPLIYSGPVRRALRLCEEAHRGVNRKSGDVPYMAHPVSVAMLLAAAGAGEEPICAAFVHDVPEDTERTLSEIADLLGRQVAQLTAALTKAQFAPDGRTLSKDEVNEQTFQTFATAELDAVADKAADLAVNITDVILDGGGDPGYLQVLYGPKAPAKAAHYLRLSELLHRRLTDAGAYPLLADVLAERAHEFALLAGHGVRAPGPRPAHAKAVPLIYSGQVRGALQLAERVHRGMLRKGAQVPFILHPIAVAALLAGAGAPEELLCAAYLEDTVQKTGLTVAGIEDRFGHRVAELVAAVTAPQREHDAGKLDPARRAQLTERSMESAPLAVCALKAADAAVNITDLVLDHQELGAGHWEVLFGERLELKLGYYVRLAGILTAHLRDAGAYPLLADMLTERAEMLARLMSARGLCA